MTREKLKHQKCPTLECKTMSTQTLYAIRCKMFREWCGLHHLDPVQVQGS